MSTTPPEPGSPGDGGDEDRVADLVGGLIHELNQPLAAIMNLAELARRQPGLAPDVAEHLDGVLGETRRMHEFVRSLAPFARSRSSAAAWEAPAEDLLRGSMLGARRALRAARAQAVLRVGEPGLPPVSARGRALVDLVQACVDAGVEALAGAQAGAGAERLLEVRVGPGADDASLEVVISAPAAAPAAALARCAARARALGLELVADAPPGATALRLRLPVGVTIG